MKLGACVTTSQARRLGEVNKNPDKNEREMASQSDQKKRESEITFKTETVMKLLQTNFEDPKTKVSGEALELMGELMRVFVKEAAMRSAEQAKDESSVVVEQKHFEKVLPQLLLDF